MVTRFWALQTFPQILIYLLSSPAKGQVCTREIVDLSSRQVVLIVLVGIQETVSVRWGLMILCR